MNEAYLLFPAYQAWEEPQVYDLIGVDLPSLTNSLKRGAHSTLALGMMIPQLLSPYASPSLLALLQLPGSGGSTLATFSWPRLFGDSKPETSLCQNTLPQARQANFHFPRYRLEIPGHPDIEKAGTIFSIKVALSCLADDPSKIEVSTIKRFSPYEQKLVAELLYLAHVPLDSFSKTSINDFAELLFGSNPQEISIDLERFVAIAKDSTESGDASSHSRHEIRSAWMRGILNKEPRQLVPSDQIIDLLQRRQPVLLVAPNGEALVNESLNLALKSAGLLQGSLRDPVTPQTWKAFAEYQMRAAQDGLMDLNSSNGGQPFGELSTAAKSVFFNGRVALVGALELQQLDRSTSAPSQPSAQPQRQEQPRPTPQPQPSHPSPDITVQFNPQRSGADILNILVEHWQHGPSRIWVINGGSVVTAANLSYNSFLIQRRFLPTTSLSTHFGDRESAAFQRMQREIFQSRRPLSSTNQQLDQILFKDRAIVISQDQLEQFIDEFNRRFVVSENTPETSRSTAQQATPITPPAHTSSLVTLTRPADSPGVVFGFDGKLLLNESVNLYLLSSREGLRTSSESSLEDRVALQGPLYPNGMLHLGQKQAEIGLPSGSFNEETKQRIFGGQVRELIQQGIAAESEGRRVELPLEVVMNQAYSLQSRYGIALPCQMLDGAQDPTVVARSVQICLAASGYYVGAIDGDFGSGSRAALIDYQVFHGLPITPDNPLNIETLAFMFGGQRRVPFVDHLQKAEALSDTEWFAISADRRRGLDLPNPDEVVVGQYVTSVQGERWGRLHNAADLAPARSHIDKGRAWNLPLFAPCAGRVTFHYVQNGTGGLWGTFYPDPGTSWHRLGIHKVDYLHLSYSLTGASAAEVSQGALRGREFRVERGHIVGYMGGSGLRWEEGETVPPIHGHVQASDSSGAYIGFSRTMIRQVYSPPAPNPVELLQRPGITFRDLVAVTGPALIPSNQGTLAVVDLSARRQVALSGQQPVAGDNPQDPTLRGLVDRLNNSDSSPLSFDLPR